MSKENDYLDILKEAQYSQSAVAYLGGLLLMIDDLNPEFLATNFDETMEKLSEDYYELAVIFVQALRGLNEELFFNQTDVSDIYELVESEYGFDLEDYTITEAECFEVSQRIANQDIPLEVLIGMGYIGKFHKIVNAYEENLTAKRKMMS